MTDQLQELIEKAKSQVMTPEQLENQRINFVYGNMKLADVSVTKGEVIRASKVLRESRLDDERKPPVQDASGEE